MRIKEAIAQDLRTTTDAQAQFQILGELLLDIRTLLMASTAQETQESTPPPIEKKPKGPLHDKDYALLALPFSTRTKSALLASKLRYLSDLEGVTSYDLLKLRNFGYKCLDEMRTVLAVYDVVIEDMEEIGPRPE